jgi:hypothetical protein
MLPELLAAATLLALTVIVHAMGMVAIFRWVVRLQPRLEARFWALTWVVIRTAWCLIAIHLVEIALWALFFWRQRCLPDLESAFYFAGVTYTTVGYGDLVLSKEWRLLGPVEGLTGILMCGLSTGFFFALVSRLYAPQKKDARPG